MPKTRPPQQIRARRTRRRLLAAARRVIAERGYADASIDDITREAGYSKGAYYFHFAAKEDVLLALVDGWLRDSAQRLASVFDQQAVVGATPLDALEALIVPATGQPGLALELWSQAQRNAVVAQRLAQARDAWRDLLVHGFQGTRPGSALPPEVTAEAAADIVLTLHAGVVLGRLPSRVAPAERVAPALALVWAASSRQRFG